MVRANCANTNAKIRAPLSSHPQARRSRLIAPSPAAGGRIGLPLGPWASGGHAGRTESKQDRAALRARFLRGSPDVAAGCAHA
jgi:hypothetical protein